VKREKKKSLIPVFRNTAVSKKKKVKGRFFHTLRDQGKRALRKSYFFIQLVMVNVCFLVSQGRVMAKNKAKFESFAESFLLFVVEPHIHLF
jgi:hypothetical protein